LYGTVNGQRVTVGKLDYLESMGVDLSLLKESVSGSVVAVAFGKKLTGTFAIADTLRPEAAQAVTELQKAGIKRTVMLTGDQAAIAKTIAAEVGVDEYHADLLPQDKEALAGKFRDKYGASAMVGDGINDAPVLAASNVGIAIGTAGNDIAIEAADVALMNANLLTIPYLIRHGRKSVRKLQVNLGIALGLKAFMIIGGVLGIVPLWVAVLGDDGATLLVIANALPLLRHTLKSPMRIF
jgi:Cd2+/Zn2+-exporting ATPase